MIKQVVDECFREVFVEIMGGPAPDINENSVLLETGLDSIGFAILVTTLEGKLGFDPFSLSNEAQYPITFGEFYEFYEKYK